MAELLLELLSEEIPARMQARAAEDLKRLVTTGLAEAGLSYDEARAYVTPRRLALVVEGVPEKTEDVREEKRGPRTDAPEKAVQGFLKSNGITLDQAEKRETEKGEFYFAVIEKKGRETTALLPDIISDIVFGFPWPKSMRWGAGGATKWVRPLHGLLVMFGGGHVDMGTAQINLTDPENAVEFYSSNETCGHRFLAPKPFPVKDFDDYDQKLETAKVILDPSERRERILIEARKLASQKGFELNEDHALLDEVVGLVEWPVVLMGEIGEAFMDLPDEVLETALRTHQKYFTLFDARGGLAPYFIFVSNMETQDKGKAIIEGNERVLRARLSDALFFWEQDRKRSLASRAPKLKDIVFHAKLGTLDEKVDRVQALAASLARHIDGADIDKVRSAARLAKADLVTEMVYEFPEVQGVMGRYYALHDGEAQEVADAIAEHYRPQGPNDDCPTKPVSIAVALADKIDTLVGFWVIGEKPTGSKDPFALRRAALGVIRLILENGLRLDLLSVFETAQQAFSAKGAVGADLLSFFADRLKVHLREEGVRHDFISAVFALGGQDDLVALLARVNALKDFLETEDGANLLVAYRRAANILRIEEKKDSTTYDGTVDERLLEKDDEKALVKTLATVSTESAAAIQAEDFSKAMAALANLRLPVDAFFDNVTVNVDNAALRKNRLNILARIRAAMDEVADFSQIEGE